MVAFGAIGPVEIFLGLILFHKVSRFNTFTTKAGIRTAILSMASVFALSGFESINLSGPAKISDLVIVIQNIISILAPIAAVAFLIMLIVGGFQFLTSGGDPKAVAGARTTLTYAVIGIILVVVLWLILLVMKNIPGVDTTTVTIPESP